MGSSQHKTAPPPPPPQAVATEAPAPTDESTVPAPPPVVQPLAGPLTSANVRLIKSWTEGSITGKRRKVRQVEVHSGSWGSVANPMPASAFGLNVIEEVTPVNAGGHVYLAVPATNGSPVTLFASVGGASAAADVVASPTPNGMYFTVKGY